MFRRSAKPLLGRYLSLAEREEIALLLVQGNGVCEIARRLGRAASTISREIRRNAATRSGNLDDRATAQWHAERAARRPKVARLAANIALRSWVEDRLSGAVAKPGALPVIGPTVSWNGRRHGPRQHRRWSKAWSPEQISAHLLIDFPDNDACALATKPSTKRCSFRVEEHCAVISPPACAADEPFAFRGRVSASVAKVSYRLRS